MGYRMHMAKVYKQTIPSDGTSFDYDLSVRYYDKVYFTNCSNCGVEEWMDKHLGDDWSLYIPDEHGSAPWEISKSAIDRVKTDPERYRAALADALRLGFIKDEKELQEFFTDALASDCTDDIIRLEWW